MLSMKVKELEEELGRIAKNEQDLEKKLLDVQSASAELKLEHGEYEETLRSYEMFKDAKEALEQELEAKIEEGLAREELIKKGTAMVEDLENRLEDQEDLVGKLEDAQLVHAKELEAAEDKLMEEQIKNDAVVEEMQRFRADE